MEADRGKDLGTVVNDTITLKGWRCLSVSSRSVWRMEMVDR